MATINQCCNCGDDVGPESLERPFIFREDVKPIEAWCPPCFCYHRAFLEPAKYHPGCFVAIMCGKCKKTSIDHGPLGQCGQCGSHNVRVVGPKKHAGTLLQQASLAPVSKKSA